MRAEFIPILAHVRDSTPDRPAGDDGCDGYARLLPFESAVELHT